MDKKTLQSSILEKAYQPSTWLDVMKDYFGAKKFHQKPQTISLPNNDIAESAVELGSFYTADERLVGMYEVHLTPKAWLDKNRVGLRNLLRSVYKYDVDGALIVFVQGEKWRFSFVSEIRTEEGKKETEPKRYTYLFGEGESCRTAAERFDKLKGKPLYLADLFDAFSVEKLNKDFFKSYKEFFEKFSAHLAANSEYRKLFLGTKKELEKGWQDDEAKPIRDFTKKLLGRIVFLQFLEKKGWMGVPANNEKWTGGDGKFLQNLFLNYADKEHFHSKALKTLFFETLNKKRSNHFAPSDLGTDIKIPYLNGGLFDKDISYNHNINFPADLFKNLLEFFESYNFTIDENDPYDSEVGIDPEMLGHIFENLLEENREKGAFYTPKEIVHYMCQESLIQYLRTHLPECTEDESPATKALENFIRNGIVGERNDKKNFVVQQAKRIEKLLDKVKICDPAIGSGAFPMGMLQEIFKAKTALDLTLDHAETKKQIIQNCIYGVDIENGAVEIARLRFWLALVVDEETPQPLPNLDYKIMQGNSLLESFEGINLKFERKKFEVKVEKQKNLFGEVNEPQMSLTDYLQGKQEANEFDIIELENTYFNSNDADEKEEIRRKIDRIEKEFISEQLQKKEDELKELLQAREKDYRLDMALATSEAMMQKIATGKKAKELEKLKADLQKVELSKQKLLSLKRHEKPYFLWSLYFMDVFDKGGFDIVIGNPPYVGQKGNKEMFQVIKDSPLGFKYHQRRMDLFYFFFHHGIEILKNKGVLSYITTNYFLTATYADKLRKHIYDETTILSLSNFNELKIFESALGQHNLITTLKKGKFEEIQAKTFITQRDGLANEEIINAIVREQDNLTEYNLQSQKSLFEKETFYLRIESQLHCNKTNYGISAFLNRIKDNSDSFSKYFNIEQGIVSGADKVSDSIIQEFPHLNLNKGDGIFILTKEEVQSLNLSNEELKYIKPIYKNSDLKKWYFIPKNKLYIIYLKDEGKPIELGRNLRIHFEKFKEVLTAKKENCFKNHWLRKIVEPWLLRGNYFVLFYPRNKDSFEKFKIVNSRRSYTNSFALEDRGFFEQSDIVFSTLKQEFENKLDIKYFLAILNSKLLYCWFYHKGKRKGEQLELFQKPISEVPIKIGESNIQIQISTLVDRIINNKKENLESTFYENKIDALVFHLYGLTEQEMLQVLDTFKDLSIKDRNQIQNEYWNIANNKFQLDK